MQSGVNAAEWFRGWVAAGRSAAGPFGTETAPLAPVVLPPQGLSGITLLGRSMGGTVSTYIAKVSGWTTSSLLLQSTFSNLKDLAQVYFPMFGWIWAKYAEDGFPQFTNTGNIRDYSSCLYVSHSKDDEWVPYNMGEEVYAAANKRKASCSQFVVVTTAIHTQPLTVIERTTIATWFDSQRV